MQIEPVGCVKSKLNRPAPERDLYTSALFVGRQRAGAAHSGRPGNLDLLGWEIGRLLCRPRTPRCGEYPLGGPCPRLVDAALGVEGM